MCFLSFCVTLLYFLIKTKNDEIEKFVVNQTMKTIKEIIENEDGGDIQKKIERLQVTNMIKHTNYKDIEEISVLLKTIENLFMNSKNIDILISGKMTEKLILMVWTRRIIEASGLNSNKQIERTVYILRKIWEIVCDSVEEREEKERLKRIYTIELMIPFAEIDTEGSKKAFSMLLRVIWSISTEIILYIYMEYLYYSKEVDKYKMNSRIFLAMKNKNVEEAVIS